MWWRLLPLAALLSSAAALERRHAWLDEERRVRLHWGRPAATEGELEFLLEAATTGAVGLGFSPGGRMSGADMILGWVDDNSGRPHLVDCYGAAEGAAPQVDVEQNYKLLRGHQNSSHTVLEFSRPLHTCDLDHDMVLGEDTVRVIWSLHVQDPQLVDGALHSLHGHSRTDRGVRSLHLLAPPPPRDFPHPTHWDVMNKDFEIPDNMDTLYWCKIFKVPELEGKHHMIGYEPILEHASEGFVHHMLLYQCVAPEATTPQFESYLSHRGAACYGASMPPIWEQCLTPIVAWAIGSQGEFLPSHIGLLLAEDHKTTYFMLEIHYDNPMLRRVKDSSGLRVFYSKDLRQHDGGILISGVTVSPLHMVPPRQQEYRTAGYCNSQCTQRMFPQTGIKLVSVLLHSHLAGRKIRVRHIRDGQEVGRIAQDGHYDFNYQQSRLLAREVELLPGDELVTECSYETTNRTRPTFGGYSTKQEMCLAFILYYPRTSLASCFSMTPVKYFFEIFGVKEFYNISMAAVERMFLKLGPADDEQLNEQVRRLWHTTSTTSTTPRFESAADDMDEEVNQRAVSTLQQMKDFSEGDSGGSGGGLFDSLVIRQPAEFQNKTFISHLYELPWEEQLLTQRIEESFLYGPHMIFCRMHDDQLAIPAIVSRLPNHTADEPAWSGDNSCRERMAGPSASGDASALAVGPLLDVAALTALLAVVR